MKSKGKKKVKKTTFGQCNLRLKELALTFPFPVSFLFQFPDMHAFRSICKHCRQQGQRFAGTKCVPWARVALQPRTCVFRLLLTTLLLVILVTSLHTSVVTHVVCSFSAYLQIILAMKHKLPSLLSAFSAENFFIFQEIPDCLFLRMQKKLNITLFLF